MKSFILAILGLLSQSFAAQSLSNTYWLVYTPNTQTYTHYKFSADRLSYVSTGTVYTEVSSYFVSGSNFKIIDLWPQACPNDTGYYTFSIANNILDFTVVNDPCLPRQNTLNNFAWNKSSPVDLPAIANQTEGISIFPNPANGTIRMELRSETYISLTDLTGRTVLENKFTSGSQNLDVSGFQNGIYFLSLRSTSGVRTKRIVIQN